MAVVPGGPESAGRELYPQPHGGVGRSGPDHPVPAGDPPAAGEGVSQMQKETQSKQSVQVSFVVVHVQDSALLL